MSNINKVYFISSCLFPQHIINNDMFWYLKVLMPSLCYDSVKGVPPCRGEYITFFPNNPFGKSFWFFNPLGRVSYFLIPHILSWICNFLYYVWEKFIYIFLFNKFFLAKVGKILFMVSKHWYKTYHQITWFYPLE